MLVAWLDEAGHSLYLSSLLQTIVVSCSTQSLALGIIRLMILLFALGFCGVLKGFIPLVTLILVGTLCPGGVNSPESVGEIKAKTGSRGWGKRRGCRRESDVAGHSMNRIGKFLFGLNNLKHVCHNSDLIQVLQWFGQTMWACVWGGSLSFVPSYYLESPNELWLHFRLIAIRVIQSCGEQLFECIIALSSLLPKSEGYYYCKLTIITCVWFSSN